MFYYDLSQLDLNKIYVVIALYNTRKFLWVLYFRFFMKKFIAITTAILSLSACVAPIDGTTGAVVVPVPVPVNVPIVITEKEKEKKKDDSIYVCKIQAFNFHLHLRKHQ